jgi:hypothetical protein
MSDRYDRIRVRGEFASQTRPRYTIRNGHNSICMATSCPVAAIGRVSR